MGKAINNPEKKEHIKVSYVGTPEKGEITTGRSGGKGEFRLELQTGEAGAATCAHLTSLCETSRLTTK